MIIKEFENGEFQVWNDGLVLDPVALTWENSFQSQLPCMFVETLKSAEIAIRRVRRKENVVREHIVED